MSKALHTLAQWLAEDIEIAQKKATDEPPSAQLRLLSESIRLVCTFEMVGLDAVKLLGIAQALLSGTYQFFSEDVLLKMVADLLQVSQSDSAPQVKDKAATVAALLLNRMRYGHSRFSRTVTDAIQSAIDHAESDRQRSIFVAMHERVVRAIQRADIVRSPTVNRFKLPELDVPRAATNVREDVEGDWYQDPWGWPEIDWLASKQPKKITERLASNECEWTVAIDVGKKGGGVRPGLLMNPVDRIAYQALVDELSIVAAGDLPNWVFGWRLNRNKVKKGLYEGNKDEWKRFSNRVATVCGQFKFTAHLDIQSFFATIDTAQLLSQLGRRYRGAGVLDRIEVYLYSWHQRQNGLGIPQRSLASSVLSHAVMRPVDAFLNKLSAGGSSKSFAASRWMDDIWLHSDSEDELRNCVAEIENILSQMRLSLNSEKTEVFESKDAGKVVQLVQPYGEENAVPLDILLERTEGAPAFQIGLEVAKLLHRKEFDRLAKISSAHFSEIAHLGDRLAKAFRASGDWKRFAQTYLTFARRHVSAENVSVATWAEMFPNAAEAEVGGIQEYFSRQIVDVSQRLLTPLAAQRLVSWSTKFGAGSLAENSTFELQHIEEDAFRFRGLCFAGLKLKSIKDRIRNKVRGQADRLLADFLQDRDFQPPSLSNRFDSE